MTYNTLRPQMPLEEFRRLSTGGIPILPDTPEHDAVAEWEARARWITNYLNCVSHEPEFVRRILSELTCSDVSSSLELHPPFYAGVGVNLQFGSDVLIGQACHFGDLGGIVFGDGCIVEDNVTISTIARDAQPDRRHILYPSAVAVEHDVFIGAHSTVLPGVRIGAKAIVLAGSVVMSDVLPGTIFGGSPAQYLRDL